MAIRDLRPAGRPSIAIPNNPQWASRKASRNGAPQWAPRNGVPQWRAAMGVPQSFTVTV
jgi:hypothetical protein